MKYFGLFSALLILSISYFFLNSFFSNKKNQEYEAELIGKLCTDKLWPNAVRETGDFPFAAFEGDTLCIAKGIFPHNVGEAVEIIKTGAIKRVVISSTGGDVESAIKLADEIFNRKIDVYVEGPCFSSCANYIFTAGAKKYILNGGLVAWHGAPRNREDLSPKLKLIVDRHLSFYKKIGVFEEITWRFPCDLQADAQFSTAVRESSTVDRVLWTYTNQSMARDFNLHNVIMLWTPKSTKELREFTQFQDVYSKVFLSKGC